VQRGNRSARPDRAQAQAEAAEPQAQAEVMQTDAAESVARRRWT